jgi:diguanylate cyclase (GGDEF)-like protein
VDRFKAVNDTYGHATGDRVLRMVGQTLAHGLRASDTALRWGGEEFLAIVRATRLDTVADVAERLRILVANSWVDIDGARLAVTVSIGATLAGTEEPLERAVDRADRLMYASKQAGRNRVTCRAAAQPAVRHQVVDLATTPNA